MRKYLILVVLAGLAVMLALPAAAVGAAPAPRQLRASFVTVSTMPGSPLGCPAGFEDGWRIGSSGSGELLSPVYSGPVLVDELHCSRWLARDPSQPGPAVGDVADGRLTFTAVGHPESRLVLSFAGVFQLTGDPTGAFFSRITLQVTIVDGTGVFAGASGSGHLAVTGDAFMVAALVGSFVTG